MWAAIGQIAVGATGNTISALANKQQNDAQQEMLKRSLNITLAKNNQQLMRSRSSYAAKGIAAGTTLGVNEERQAAMNSIAEYAVQSDALRISTQLGFINAALSTSVNVAQVTGQYRREQIQTRQLEALQSRVEEKETLVKRKESLY